MLVHVYISTTIISIMLTLVVNPGSNKTPMPVATASLDACDSQQAALSSSVACQHTTGQDTNGMLHMSMCACVRQ